MKKILTLALVFLGAAAIGCKAIDKLLTFYVEDTENIQIAASFPVGVAAPLSPVAVPTQSKQTFQNNNTRADLVKDVSLNQLTLTIADPTSENFDFLRSIEIYISTNASDQILLASLGAIPTGVQSITLTPTNARLDAYLKADSYTLTTKAAIAKPITRAVTIRSVSRFKVTADPL